MVFGRFGFWIGFVSGMDLLVVHKRHGQTPAHHVDLEGPALGLLKIQFLTRIVSFPKQHLPSKDALA